MCSFRLSRGPRGHRVPYAMTAPPSLRALRPAAGRPGRLGLGVLLFLVLLVFALPTLIRLAAEWPWFNSIGYGRVFTTRLLAGGLLGLVVGAIAFAFLYANLRFAQRGVTPNPVLVRLNPQAAPLDVTRFVRRLALPAALGVGLLFAIGAAGAWLPVLQFLHPHTVRRHRSRVRPRLELLRVHGTGARGRNRDPYRSRDAR